jgi:hypothetical protein
MRTSGSETSSRKAGPIPKWDVASRDNNDDDYYYYINYLFTYYFRKQYSCLDWNLK